MRLSLPVHVELDECNASVIADGQHSRKLSGTAVVSPEIASEGGSGKGDTGAARMCRRGARCGQIGFTALLQHIQGVIARFDQSGATTERFGRCRWDLDPACTNKRESDYGSHRWIPFACAGRRQLAFVTSPSGFDRAGAGGFAREPESNSRGSVFVGCQAYGGVENHSGFAGATVRIRRCSVMRMKGLSKDRDSLFWDLENRTIGGPSPAQLLRTA
jgi:hypothetical protein